MPVIPTLHQFQDAPAIGNAFVSGVNIASENQRAAAQRQVEREKIAAQQFMAMLENQARMAQINNQKALAEQQLAFEKARSDAELGLRSRALDLEDARTKSALELDERKLASAENLQAHQIQAMVNQQNAEARFRIRLDELTRNNVPPEKALMQAALEFPTALNPQLVNSALKERMDESFNPNIATLEDGTKFVNLGDGRWTTLQSALGRDKQSQPAKVVGEFYLMNGKLTPIRYPSEIIAMEKQLQDLEKKLAEDEAGAIALAEYNSGSRRQDTNAKALQYRNLQSQITNLKQRTADAKAEYRTGLAQSADESNARAGMQTSQAAQLARESLEGSKQVKTGRSGDVFNRNGHEFMLWNGKLFTPDELGAFIQANPSSPEIPGIKRAITEYQRKKQTRK